MQVVLGDLQSQGYRLMDGICMPIANTYKDIKPQNSIRNKRQLAAAFILLTTVGSFLNYLLPTLQQHVQPNQLSIIQRHIQTLDKHTAGLDDQIENIFVMDLILHRAHGAIASLSAELRDYLAPKPQFGVGKMLLQRMPRTLTQRQDMQNAVIPPELVSYQTAVQAHTNTPTRTCDQTTLITRGQAPYYKDRNLNLRHKNTVANDEVCYHVPDTSFQYLHNQISIKWPFLQVLRNLTTCISEISQCRHVLVKEPNCTQLEWAYFLHNTSLRHTKASHNNHGMC